MKINIKMKKISAFTLLEILFISILLSAGLLFVAKAIQHAKEVNYKVIQSVIANQIATEWVEIVYQLRNTNFLKYEKVKPDYEDFVNKRIINSCRLAHDFDDCLKMLSSDYHGLTSELWFDNSLNDNEKKLFLKTWYYYITNDWWINTINNCYYDKEDPDRQKNCSKISQDIYSICQNDWSWIPCTWWHAAGNDESKYWHFYRYIEWLGSYDMNSSETGWTIINPNYFAANIDAQEYRFCCRVFREWMQWWELEICATMTNFND